MFAAGKTAVSGQQPDAQFNYVTMLLHGDGTNGAQNNTFLDSSTNNFTITRNGNTTQGSFSPYGSNWSNFFDGNGDYLTCSVSVPATGAFTVEMFVFPTSTAGYQLLFSQFTSGNAGSLQILWDDTTDKFTVNIGTGTVLTSSSTYALNTWHHLAITRDGSNNMTMWVNGASAATTTNSTSILQATTFIGTRSVALDGYFNGYISNLRVTNTAVYTTAFTPSTTPLTAISGTTLLTCADNRFIDDSASPKTITVNGNTSVQRFNPFGTSTAYSTAVIGGSGYFDGSGDYLSAPDNTAFEFGSGNFTIEAWAYPLDGGFQMLVAKSPDNQATGWQFFASGDELSFFASTGGSWNVGFFSSSAPIKRNAWNHLAVTRNGSTWTIWVNGVSQATTTSSITINNNTTPVFIGTFSNASYFSYGYTADVRIIKGTALYTSNFTPPTAPLTAITNTSLLTSFTNGAIFDNAMMNNLETVGNAQISTSVKKYGTGSMYFDGTDDYLKIPYSPNLQFGTGAYTFEFWLNTSSVSQWLVFNAENNSGIRLYVQSNGTLELDEQVANADNNIYSTATVNDGAWHHIALSRAGGAGTKMFVDGIYQSQQASAYNFNDSVPYYIGTRSNLSGFLTGYIDDLRITKGYARYTANFTPPTSAFQDTGPY